MGKRGLIVVCCPNCGGVVARTSVGPETFTKCPKCKYDLRYVVKPTGPEVGFYKKSDIIMKNTGYSAQM